MAQTDPDNTVLVSPVPFKLMHRSWIKGKDGGNWGSGEDSKSAN